MLTTEDCYAYLSSLHTTLWADYIIEDPDRRQLAAAWLAEQFSKASAHAQEARRITLPERRETQTFFPPQAGRAGASAPAFTPTHGQQPERF